MNLYPKASAKHRLGGYVLDIGLAIVTLGIGWLIWSLIAWRKGQTPAKQILQLRVVAEENRTNATWGHMAIRQLLIPLTFAAPGWILLRINNGTDPIDAEFSSDPLGGQGLANLADLITYSIALADALWIFKGGERKRVTDIWAKTIVVNEANPIGA